MSLQAMHAARSPQADATEAEGSDDEMLPKFKTKAKTTTSSSRHTGGRKKPVPRTKAVAKSKRVKATPLKSEYFGGRRTTANDEDDAPDGEVNEDDDDDDELNDQASEQEVVTPRRTTRRTRGR
jgi:xeroderma pigmentosum group C-complementing protein